MTSTAVAAIPHIGCHLTRISAAVVHMSDGVPSWVTYQHRQLPQFDEGRSRLTLISQSHSCNMYDGSWLVWWQQTCTMVVTHRQCKAAVSNNGSHHSHVRGSWHVRWLPLFDTAAIHMYKGSRRWPSHSFSSHCRVIVYFVFYAPPKNCLDLAFENLAH